MNRSRYLSRHLDEKDRVILTALAEDGRMSIRQLGERIGLSSPSITDRVNKLKDAGAIRGYTVLFDPKAFGLSITAYVRMNAMPGHSRRVEEMLKGTPEVVEADHITGEDCFIAKMVVRDVQELETVVDQFVPFATTHTAIIQSATVVRRLPKL
jgi:Lrp/AsnC family leucine-responsive transcriptional regulator